MMAITEDIQLNYGAFGIGSRVFAVVLFVFSKVKMAEK
jgi:hypothetical protein